MSYSRFGWAPLLVGLLSATALDMNSSPAGAVPVLFGEANISVDGGRGSKDVPAGSAVTVNGPLLQLRLADGSTITVPKGTTFKITNDDPLAIDVLSGSLRVDSKGALISVSRGGTTISTKDGAFSAFASGDGGLDGRVNEGTATVSAGGDSRDFGKGEGYVASGDGVSGTFTPPPASTPQLAGGNPPEYSPADQHDSAGDPVVAVDAVGDGGGEGSPGYGGTPPVTGVTVPLTGTEHSGRSVVYAGDVIGIDQRSDVAVTVGDGGELNGYRVGDGSDENLERNSNASLERGNANDEIFVERWAGGETRGNYYSDTAASALARTSYQGFHLVYGTPGTDIPSGGVATYELAAATAPTIDNGSSAPGTFSGSLGILFGPTFKVGLDFSVSMPGDHTYEIATAGGAENPSAIPSYLDLGNGIFALNGLAVAQGGNACPTANCQAFVDGLIGGDEASSVGIAYQIYDSSIEPDSTGRARRISGAAAFTQTSYDADGGSGGSEEPESIESGSLDAPLRLVASNGYQGVAFLSPIQSFTREAAVSTAVMLDEDGRFTGFTSNYNGAGTYDINDAVIADLAGTAYVQIGRWNGGSIEKNGSTYFTVAGWQGVPYLVGIQTLDSNMPVSGIATYALASATAPIFASGAFGPGTLSGSAAVAFSAGGLWNLGLDATVEMSETSGTVTYDISTAGGIVDPSQSPISGSVATYTIASPSGSSICVSPTCTVDIRKVILAGPSARDLGLAYAISQNSSDAIMGTAIFQRTDNPVLFRQDIGLEAMVLSPGTLVLTGGYGMQAFASHDANVTYTDSAPGLEQVTSAGSSSVFAAGEAQIVDKGADGPLTWSRWTDGATGEIASNSPGPVLGSDQGIHVISGTPATNVPTSGTAQYALVGSTAPTIADNSVAAGSFTGTMAVAFGTTSANSRVGLDLHVSIGGHTYDIATTGGAATPSSSQIALYGSHFGSAFGHPSSLTIATGGPACTGASCKADVSGFLSGDGASHAALAYTISSTGSPNISNAVQGAAAFSQP